MEKGTNNYTKEELINFLQKNGINNGILERINNLPDFISVDDKKYDLNILITQKKSDDIYYEFELNYYSKKNVEFLLPYSIRKDIEVSINVLECELMNRKLIDYEVRCEK